MSKWLPIIIGAVLSVLGWICIELYGHNGKYTEIRADVDLLQERQSILVTEYMKEAKNVRTN